ncbi:MAG: hypothetical protein J6W03_09935 [Bacteroidaceae bacterium]|nr:hypothetical protein [Bacteroidaceae bacterium]
MTYKSFLLAALVVCGISFSSCNKADEDLNSIAYELCQYIPDHQLLERSKDFMTSDFYAVLDTMFNLPEHEAMDHEWLYYFVTGNGGTIADYTVDTVELKDKTHAVALLTVRQKWDDGSFSPEEDTEEHKLYMEKVGGKWLISDFDEHKQDCIHYIAIWRQEEALRQTMRDYLVKEIGSGYQQGDISIPVLMIVANEEGDDSDENDEPSSCKCYGDFWVFNYNIVGDTLKTVSGGNHSGCMYVEKNGGKLQVTRFEQTEDGAGNVASARRIFGEHYDVFQYMHGSDDLREAVRREQLQQYIQQHQLDVKYYQDFGWDAVPLED